MKQDENYKPIIYLAIVLILFYCSSLFILIPVLIFNIDLNNCSDVVTNLLRLFYNFITSLILFLLYRKELKKEFKELKNNFGTITDIAFKYWITGFLIMMISNTIIGLFSPIKIPSNESSVRELIISTPLISFFFISIFAPFNEEIIFRKSFKDVFKNKWVFAITSGLTFGLLHVIGNITSLYELLYFIPYTSLGIVFALANYKTNNIFTSMIMHFLHNTLILILYIYML